MQRGDLPEGVYGQLLGLRTALRRFERWSAERAAGAGLTPAQHQLLLAVRGHPDPHGPTIGEVADYLLLRHHSVVGLVDRTEALGLLHRVREDSDHRLVRLRLSEEGRRRIEELSALHLEEVRRLATVIPRVTGDLEPVGAPRTQPPSWRRARTS